MTPALPVALVCVVATAVVVHRASTRLPAFLDEVWFVQVVSRLRAGERLYDEVFFGAGPVPVWMAVACAGSTERRLLRLRRLRGAYDVMTVAASVALLHSLGAGPAAMVCVAVAYIGMSGPIWRGESHYGALSRLGAVLCAVFVVEAGASGGAGWVVAAGLASAVAIMAKHSIGVVVAVSALATVVIVGGGITGAALFISVTLLAVGVVVGALVHQGLLGAYVQRAITNKRTFVETGRSSFRLGFASSLPRRASSRRTNVTQLVSTSFFVMMAASPAWVVLAVTAGATHAVAAVDAGAVVLLVVAAITCAVPRADADHLRGAAPLCVLGAVGACVLATRAWGWPLELVSAVSVGLLGVCGLAAASHSWIGPRPTDSSSFPCLEGVIVCLRESDLLVRVGSQLRAATRGRVFVLMPDASLWYLACGLENPTPYDFPLASTFGPSGQDDVIEDLAAGRIEWCFMSASGAAALAPERLERFVPEAMVPMAETHAGVLYRSSAV